MSTLTQMQANVVQTPQQIVHAPELSWGELGVTLVVTVIVVLILAGRKRP